MLPQLNPLVLHVSCNRKQDSTNNSDMLQSSSVTNNWYSKCVWSFFLTQNGDSYFNIANIVLVLALGTNSQSSFRTVVVCTCLYNGFCNLLSACIYFEVALYLTEMYPLCRRWSGEIGSGALNSITVSTVSALTRPVI